MSTVIYDDSSVKVLDAIQHIQHRSGMYIGSTQNPNQLLKEIFHNSLDEAIFSKKPITIVLDFDENVYSVTDYGRGIPQGNIQDPKYGNLPIPVIVACQMNSSGKFDKKSYDTPIGTHGVGMVAVNALSNWMEVDTKRNGIRHIYKFNNGKWDLNVRDEEPLEYSTKVSFNPSKRFFKSTKIQLESLRNDLFLASANSGAKIVLKIIKNRKEKEEIFDQNIHQYFEYIYPMMKDKMKYRIEAIGNMGEKIVAVFGYNFESTKSGSHGSINLVGVDQGTHINKTALTIRNMFFDFNKDKDVLKEDFNVSFYLYVGCMLREPTFSSQTKEKLNNDYDDIKYMVEILSDKMTKYFKSNPEELKVILDGVSDYRARLNNKKNVKSKIIKTDRLSRGLTSSESRLRDCSSKQIDSTRLFIVEGMSAAGSLIQCRDPKIDAVLPLRGKILNILNSNDDKMFKNKEILDIVNSIGVGTIHTGIHLDKIRYNKIIILTDADYDGDHIATLLMSLFINVIPEVVKDGKIYYANPPLFGYKNKNAFTPIFDEDEAFEMIKSGKQLIRFKGLGEMNPEELHTAILDERYRNWQQFEYPESEDLQYINSLLTDTNVKRQLLFGEGEENDND